MGIQLMVSKFRIKKIHVKFAVVIMDKRSVTLLTVHHRHQDALLFQSRVNAVLLTLTAQVGILSEISRTYGSRMGKQRLFIFISVHISWAECNSITILGVQEYRKCHLRYSCSDSDDQIREKCT